YYNNAYYAKVGGISTREMNFLEVDFLFGLGFHLNVTPSTFHTYYSYLQKEMMLHPHCVTARSSKIFLSSNYEDESSHQQQHQQLAV
ncbi:Cyclin p4,1, partial [Dorcoceras hygrometricum]